MSDDIHKGHCQCGAVRLRAKGPPNWVATCHCVDCRRATGAAMATYAGFDSGKAVIKGEKFSEYESSPGTFRGFCATCGSRLTFRSTKWAGELHIHTGALDDADALAPRGNVFVKEKLAWVVLEPDLPAFNTVTGAED